MLPILRFPRYFETPLFRTFFHFPWDFEIAGFNCIYQLFAQSHQFLAILFIKQTIRKAMGGSGEREEQAHTHTHKINAREKQLKK